MTGEQLLAEQILNRAQYYEWFVNGIGFMFLRMSEYSRLHVYHPQFFVEGTGCIHDHFWSFYSKIISGSLTNYNYLENFAGSHKYDVYDLMICGVAEEVTFTGKYLELTDTNTTYKAGERYWHPHNMLHRTEAKSGTITLLERHSEIGKQSVRVCQNAGQEYVKWNERLATPHEIARAASVALTELKIS